MPALALAFPRSTRTAAPTESSRSARCCRLLRRDIDDTPCCGVGRTDTALALSATGTLVPQIERVWRANMQVHKADKVWRQLVRKGTVVARCTVERLMRRQDLCGVMCGKVARTTISDSKAPYPLDKVNRQFQAERPMSRPGKAGCI